MNTTRAAFFIGLLCAATASSAEETPKWEPKNETFSDWPTVSFSDGKTQHLLYYHRADAAKCDPKNKKPRSCVVDLYDLNAVGEPVNIKSRRTPVTENSNPNTKWAKPLIKQKPEEIDAKLTSYAATLSNYKLEVNEKHLQVVRGDKHFDAVRNDAISKEGSQIFVLPPRSGAALNDAAPSLLHKVGFSTNTHHVAPTNHRDRFPSEMRVSATGSPKTAKGSKPASKPSSPIAQLADDLQKKALKKQADKEAAAYRRPPFDPEAKDQSEQFEPFMTEKELVDYQKSLQGMSASRMLEFNIEQIRKITGRTPYPREEYVTESNFTHLDSWEKERYCTNFYKSKNAAGDWKSKTCSKYAGKPLEPKSEDAVSDRLTDEELALLTDKERKIYNEILGSLKGAKTNGNLQASTAFYRDKIKKEDRTKKLSSPVTMESFGKMEDWQKKDFCGNFVEQRQPAAQAHVKGSKDPLRALKTWNNCVESASQSCGKAVIDGVDVEGAIVAASAPTSEDWKTKACADFFKAMAAIPSTDGGSGGKPSGGDKPDGHDPHAENKTINGNVLGPDPDPNQTPSGHNKWLAPEHLYNGAKGSLVGILLGSLGGPVGMMAGAAAGALFFYGLSKITSDKN